VVAGPRRGVGHGEPGDEDDRDRHGQRQQHREHQRGSGPDRRRRGQQVEQAA
jgi:hypothetical protein